MPNEFEVVYNSDLVINDNAELATLCVFYDRVYLPYTDNRSCMELIGASKGSSQIEYLTESKNYVRGWETEYDSLFRAGVLKRVEPLETDGGEEVRISTRQVRSFIEPELGLDEKIISAKEDHEQIRSYRKNLNLNQKNIARHLSMKRPKYETIYTIRKSEKIPVRKRLDNIRMDTMPDLLSLHVHKIGSGTINYIRKDVASHLLRTDIQLPQLFATPKGRATKEILVALEAKATFAYLLPKLKVLSPQEILEVREKVRDTREGFSMHLLSLSGGLRERAAQSASIEDMFGFANDLIETNLIPDYIEFRRQLDALHANSWQKVLDAAGKIVEIDSAPWTPKFWGLLLRALGLTLIETASEQKEYLSNKYQAFQFMGEIDRATRRASGVATR